MHVNVKMRLTDRRVVGVLKSIKATRHLNAVKIHFLPLSSQHFPHLDSEFWTSSTRGTNLYLPNTNSFLISNNVTTPLPNPKLRTYIWKPSSSHNNHVNTDDHLSIFRCSVCLLGLDAVLLHRGNVSFNWRSSGFAHCSQDLHATFGIVWQEIA